MLPARRARNVVPSGYFALATLDPLRGRRGLRFVPVGTTLDEALEEEGLTEGHIYRTFVDDLLVSDWPNWRNIAPISGSTVAVCGIPGPPIVVYILIAIILIATIVNLVLTLTAKQPERDSQSRFDSPTLRGLRNRVALHEPIPKIYGRYRTKPPLGAYTYTEIVGADHFLRALFVVGYGPLVMDVADMRIGETPITEFDDVEIEVRPGEMDDPPITLYPVQVTQEDLNVTISDQKMASEDVVPGEIPGSTGWQQRNTDLTTDEIGIELMLPSGIGNITGKGQNQGTSVVHLIEFRKVGETAWIRPPVGTMRVSTLASKRNDGEVVLNQIFRMGSFQIGINFPTPERAQYEVRIKNTESAGIDVEGHNTFFHETRWIAIKSFRNEAPWTKKGIAMVAVKIRATDQLQGTLDDFSLIARAKLPTWDGTIWTAPVETRNAAWAYADVLRGPANPDPIADGLIDADRLKAWADHIELHTVPDENGVPVLNPMYFDGVIDFRSTVYRALNDIAAVARGSPHMRDGRFSVVYDHDRSSETPVQMITPRNIVKDSYGGRKIFFEEAHAYRIGFKNEAKDYGDDEIIMFTTGYTATTARVYEKIEWLGITDADRVVDETRFIIAARRYRPEVHRFDMDLENIVFERGDLVVFAHDAPLLGLAYGRISALTAGGGDVAAVTLDEKVVFEPGVDYGIRIRRHHSVLQVMDSLPVQNPASVGAVETSLITLMTQIPAANAPVVGDLVSFGELGIETRRCIVHSISPGNELTAVIELQDEGDQIWGDLTQPIPPYDPGINRPRDLPPLPPEILSVEAPDHSNLIVTFKLFSGFGRSLARCEIQVRASPDGLWQDVPSVAPAGMVVAVIPGLTLDLHYDVRVRAVSATNLYSPWTQWPTPFFHSSHPVDISRYSITDLRLENILNDPTQFVGPSPQFRWQIQVIDGTELGDPVSDAPRQASIVRESEIDRFDGYLIRVLEAVWDADLNSYVPGDMIDEDVIQDHRFGYTFDHNVEDGGPRRIVFFEVAAQIDGLLTESALQLASNPPPEVPALLRLSGANGSSIELELSSASSDADWEGVIVWMSDVAGFNPSDQNLVFKGRLDRLLHIASEPGVTYYLRYASFDRFSSDPSTLNLSPENPVTANPLKGMVTELIDLTVPYGDTQELVMHVNYPPTGLNMPPWFVPGGMSHNPHKMVRFDAPYDGTLTIQWRALYAGQGFSGHFTWAVGWATGMMMPVAADELCLFGYFPPAVENQAMKNVGFSPILPNLTSDQFSSFQAAWTIDVVGGETYWFDFWINMDGTVPMIAFYDSVVIQEVSK